MPIFLDADLENIFPSRKTAFFLDADLKNIFSSRKTPLFMDKARHINTLSTMMAPVSVDRMTVGRNGLDHGSRAYVPSTKSTLFI